MASTPPETDAPAAPLAGAAQVAAGLHARRTPLVATPRGRALAGIGDVGRAARRFSVLTGLSLSARLAVQAQGADVDRHPVRPPDYWTGYTEEDFTGATRRVSTGDVALDKLVARRAEQKRGPRGRPQVHRGLPSTVHRRSRSLAGPMTAPGGMARRLQPAAIVPVPNPANSPQTAAARTPRAPRPPRPGGRDADRPRPTPVVAPAAARRPATTTPADPGATASNDVVARQPALAPGPSTTGPSVAGPGSRADARVGPPGTPASTTAALHTGSALTAGISGVPGGAPVPPPEGGDRSGRPADHLGVTSPPWPGDLPEHVEAPAPTAVAELGRRVAVRPLLSGWRAPTAWRSIAAAPGLRLLPVGPGALPTSSDVDEAAGSWADAVRRAASSEPIDLVRRLPVGGPVAVVRGAATTDPGGVGTRSATSRTVAAGDVARSDRRSTAGRDAPRTSAQPTTSWSSPAGGSPLVLRRRAATGPDGVTVEVTAWSLPPGVGATTPPGARPDRAAHPVRRAPGVRPAEHRRPGRWLGRGAGSAGSASSVGRGVPVGPLGPVRWTARADEAVVARAASTSPGRSWAASVAAASATMGALDPVAGATGSLPVAGGFTVIRGGRTEAGDPSSTRGSAAHPVAAPLRLVPDAATPVASVVRSASASGTLASDDPGSVGHRTSTAAAATGVRRAPDMSAPFVSVPGAVGAHGLPAVAAGLVGVTSRGDVSRAAGPGTVARLAHGEPVRRHRPAEPAPPALVVGARVPADGVAARRAGPSVLPSSPADRARRRIPEIAGAGRSARTSRIDPGPGHGASSAGPTWSERVAAAAVGRPIAADGGNEVRRRSDRGTVVAGHPAAGVAGLRGLPVAPAAFGVVGTGTSDTVHRSRTPHGVSETVARRARGRHTLSSTIADRWSASDAPARTLPGHAPAALRPLAGHAAAEARRPPMRPSAPGAAARFEDVLRTAAEPVRPVALPVRFRPLADRIVGRMPVQIATGTASRRALAAVGASAATTSSVIHLPAMPDASARAESILAHELTHVAAASPVPRFHGGRPSIEETAASQVERIVARAARTSGHGRGPSSPGTSGLPVAGFVGVRGATSGPPVPASALQPSASSSSSTLSRATDTTSAADLARRIESGGGGGRAGGGGAGGGGGGGGTVQRTPAPAAPAAPAAPSVRGSRSARRRLDRLVSDPVLESIEEAAEEKGVLSEEALDAIVRALEARLLDAIDRRGGLWRGGF